MEASCQHQWGKVKWAGERREGYTIPGDAPGTMGVDWRGPTHVPPTTIDRWERTCEICGKTEQTDRTETRETKVPKF
jgi:hypothetical protein